MGNVTKKGLTRRYNKYYSENLDLQTRFNEGKKYSGGWAGIVGSEVYGLFAGSIAKDTDLLLQEPIQNENLKSLDDFALGITRFASFYITVRNTKVDIIYLSALFPNNPDRSIKDFFEGNIYNVQNLAYFPRDKKIICDDYGIEAINSRTLRFLNLGAATAIARKRIGKKNMSIEAMLVQMIEEKIRQTPSFSYELPEDFK